MASVELENYRMVWDKHPFDEVEDEAVSTASQTFKTYPNGLVLE